MGQCMNLHLNSSFVNRMRLPLLCEKSGAILLALVGLMAARQNAKIFKKFSTDCIVWIFTEFNKGICYYIVLPLHFSSTFIDPF